MDKKVKLDKIDRKLLYYLDQDSRQSASKIGKRLRIHRNVVNFRIKRLRESGVIRSFVTMISPTALGLKPYKIYLQMQNLDHAAEKRIAKLIEGLPAYWAARTSGRWDYIIGVLVKDIQELNKVKNTLLNCLKGDIVNKHVFAVVEAPHYYRNYLYDGSSISPTMLWVTQKIDAKLDYKDIELLKLMAEDSRIPIIELSKKLGITAKTAISRIRRLEKANVIYDYRLAINLDRIGYGFFKCFISLKDAEDSRMKDFFAYCQQNSNIIHLVEIVGDWDFEPEIEAESKEQFYSILSEMREKFSDIIRDIETIDILREYSYVCLPK